MLSCLASQRSSLPYPFVYDNDILNVIETRQNRFMTPIKTISCDYEHNINSKRLKQEVC